MGQPVTRPQLRDEPRRDVVATLPGKSHRGSLDRPAVAPCHIGVTADVT
jgi:hypothetical protein